VGLGVVIGSRPTRVSSAKSAWPRAELDSSRRGLFSARSGRSRAARRALFFKRLQLLGLLDIDSPGRDPGHAFEFLQVLGCQAFIGGLD
jgi:hypothetical protein